jgi:hypothetical protein
MAKAYTFRENTYRTLIVLVYIMLGSLSTPGFAHTIPISVIHILPDREEVHLELIINSFELSFLSELDGNHNGYIDLEELNAKRSLLERRLLSTLRISMDGRDIQAGSMGLLLDQQNHHLIFRVHYPKKQNFESLKLVSNIEQITSKSQITQITYGVAGHQQRARLEAGANTANFGPVRDQKADGFWSSILHYQTILVLIGIILTILGGSYVTLKRLLTKQT